LLTFQAYGQVNFGIELGAGMGNTKIKNIEEYPNMFKNSASNGNVYGLLNVNVKITQRVHLKLGGGIKGQPFQFVLNESYGVNEIENNFSSQELSTLAASYYFPLVFKLKVLKQSSSPFIGIGYTYESLLNDLDFGKGNSDFQYIKKNLHMMGFQFGYVWAKDDKPKLEFVFSYELGLNNLATDSYPFSDDFVIRENDLQFGVCWYFL
jgi:hypothetical protein